MLHTQLEAQIKFIQYEVQDEHLSNEERVQLEAKQDQLIIHYNELTRKTNSLSWHLY